MSAPRNDTTTRPFEAVWPIVGEPGPFADLVADAVDDLPGLAAQAHVRLVGTPTWQAQPAIQVPGWSGYAPGWVLIARVPAVPVAAVPVTAVAARPKGAAA